MPRSILSASSCIDAFGVVASGADPSRHWNVGILIRMNDPLGQFESIKVLGCLIVIKLKLHSAMVAKMSYLVIDSVVTIAMTSISPWLN